ncbi:MAG: DUF3089 domain-containing protein [Proteobacteria bacterium]|nr:DUF3089 domain-containing protein [Pseudomonadota bacterium]MCP4917235.1 DUF3089 domain-containing protein [Pseudomonadota bacterium]
MSTHRAGLPPGDAGHVPDPRAQGRALLRRGLRRRRERLRALPGRAQRRPTLRPRRPQPGPHIGSRLLRERIQGQVDDQLVAAHLLGWPLGPESTSLPACSTADETGCVVSFKSFLADEDIVMSASYAEGSPVTCVNPADVEAAGEVTLSLAVFPTDLAYGTPVDDGYAAYPDAYAAQCQGSETTAGLEVRWLGEDDRTDPTDAARGALTGSNASHVLDMNFVVGDLLEDIRRRTE